jgi:Protein of unknown function (Hypoth_ymh)
MGELSDVDEALALPIDEMSLRLLRWLDEQDKSGIQLHVSGVINAGVWPDIPQPRVAEFLSAVIEAWDWLQARGLERLRAERRLDVELHWRIRDRVRPQFLLGEYELAAFAALREVEIRVRELSGASESLLRTKLMQEAFKTDGPLFHGTQLGSRLSDSPGRDSTDLASPADPESAPDGPRCFLNALGSSDPQTVPRACWTPSAPSTSARSKVKKWAVSSTLQARLRNRTENLLITSRWFAGDLTSLRASEVLRDALASPQNCGVRDTVRDTLSQPA